MNNADREEWIDNDEGLYDWWRMSGLSVRAFIRENRAELDRIINRMLSGKSRTHFLKYGG